MSQQSLVLTLIGEDRPGLVETVAEVIADHSGNWVESRLAHLSGQFAGLVRAQVPGERMASLEQSLSALESQGLRVSAQPCCAETPQPPGQAVTLELVGLDQPGIVRDISRALAGAGVNVEELDTEVSSASMSGEPLFRARASLRLPEAVDLESLGETLEKLGNELMVDIELVD